jgi:uncharacterized protein (TIGR03382 family)
MLSAAIFALIAGPALAISPEYGINNARPMDGLLDVPLNVAPTVGVVGLSISTATTPSMELELVLVDLDTELRVPATVWPIGSDLYQIQPEANLQAETEYAVYTVPGFEGDEDATYVTGFTTGTAKDSDVPTTPQPIGVEQESYTDEWGDWHLLRVQQRPAVDPVGVVYSVVVESLHCATRGDCGAPPMSWALGGEPTWEAAHDGSVNVEYLRFARDPTGAVDEIASMDPSDSVIRIFTEDLAGNGAQMVCSIPMGVDAADVGCGDAAAVGVHSAGGEEHGSTPPEEDSQSGSSDLADSGDDKISGCSVSGATPVLTLALLSLAAVGRRRVGAEP